MRGTKRWGFSLVELTLVLALLGILALVALPSGQPTQSYKLELAAVELADAYRFARSESLRTGSPHGTHTDPSQNRVRVFRADTGTTPATPIYDVYHPIHRKLYDVDLDLAPEWTGVAMSAGATWLGACSAPTLLSFDAGGTPHCSNPGAVLLDQATVQLSLAGETRDVVIDGETGRVWIQ